MAAIKNTEIEDMIWPPTLESLMVHVYSMTLVSVYSVSFPQQSIENDSSMK